MRNTAMAQALNAANNVDVSDIDIKTRFAVENELGISFCGMSKLDAELRVEMLMLRNADLKDKHDAECSSLDVLVDTGTKVSGQEYGIFVRGELLARDFWSHNECIAALKATNRLSDKRLRIKPFGKPLRGSTAVVRKRKRIAGYVSEIKSNARIQAALNVAINASSDV